jgi:hypothetical protein
MTARSALSSLNHSHPRLFLSPRRLERLRRGAPGDRASGDGFFAGLREALFRQADLLLQCEATEFRIVGPRMLERSQQVLRRVATLALAFRASGRPEYLDRARTELFAAAAFPHWNPDHFLDTAELCTAFAIGYDWLYDAFSETDRERIREALIEKGLRPGAELQRKPAWWVSVRHNWNTVCNGGLAIGALAVADEQPELAASILDAALANLPRALDSFAPDGAWEAGPHYWEYTAWYSALTIDALTTALGTDLGLSSRPGFERAGLFPLHCTGPSGQYFNYADSAPASAAKPVLFWLGQRFGLANCIAENHRMLRLRPEAPDPFDLLWYEPLPQEIPALPAAACFGRAEVVLMRGAWNDARAVFLGFKAGSGQADHGHLDLGSFVLDASGVRWAVDLGEDDYDLPGYWDSGAEGGRWNYYRLNNRSHNTLVLNDHLQDPIAATAISRSRLSGPSPFAVADLSAAYGRDADSLERGAALIDNRAVLIQDEIAWRAGSQERALRWQLLTGAEITLNGREAALTQDGQVLHARILSPPGARFMVASANREAPQNPNAGYRQLVLEYSESAAETRVAVLLSTTPVEVVVRPLSSWQGSS